MSAATLPQGNPVPLVLQLEDGATGLFPQAEVVNPAGTPVVGSPFDLDHDNEGLYQSEALSMPAEDWIAVTYIVYTDAGHTTESSNHLRVSDVFLREGALEAVVASGIDPADC